MKTKIAPTLQQLVGYTCSAVGFESAVTFQALAELRALLAVARAARHEGWGADHHETRSNGTCRLCRALKRLARASRPAPGEGAP